MKLISIEGGGDWFDASVDYLKVPDDLSLETARSAWQEWYKTYKPGRDRFMPLSEFIVERLGGTAVTNVDIEVWHDH